MSGLLCTYCVVEASRVAARIRIQPAELIIGGNSVCMKHAEELLEVKPRGETDRERRERQLREAKNVHELSPDKDLKRPSDPLEALRRSFVEDVE